MKATQLLAAIGKSSDAQLTRCMAQKNAAQLLGTSETSKFNELIMQAQLEVELPASKQEIRCYISSPNKDGEVPKDGNQPDKDDVPTEHQPPQQKVV